MIEIPSSALTEFNGHPAVWIVDPKALTVEIRNVDVLRFDPATVTISQGLDTGDVVVTAGVQALRPGQKVRLLGSTHEVVEPFRVGPQSSVARRLSHDRRCGGGRRCPISGSAATRIRVSSSRRWWSRRFGRARRPRTRSIKSPKGSSARCEETPHLDFLRSFTTSGATTIFVNLKGSTSATEVADTWYHVRKSIGDIRHTLPSGVVGTVLQRRVRRHIRDHIRLHRGRIYAARASRLRRGHSLAIARSARCRQNRNLGAQDEQIFIEFSMRELATLGIDRGSLIAALQAQNIVRPSGVIQTGNEIGLGAGYRVRSSPNKT